MRADERKFVRACVGVHAWACVRGPMYVGESECRCIHVVKNENFERAKQRKRT